MSGPSQSQSSQTGDGNVKSLPWSWNQILNGKYPGKKDELPGPVTVPPVSAFTFQKAPLSLHWDEIVSVGNVGEIELRHDLQSYLSSKIPTSDSDADDSNNGGQEAKSKPKLYYWFVEVLEISGYLMKVRFLGVSATELNGFREHDHQFWINFRQLQPLGHFKSTGTATYPLKIGKAAPNLEESVNLLNTQVSEKFTVNPLRAGWIKKAKELTRWKPNTKVEVCNNDIYNEMVPGFVSETVGRRVEVSYWGVPTISNKSSGIWVHESSDLIQRQGWTKTAGARMNDMYSSYNPPPLEPSKLGVNTQHVDIKIGMLFELIDPFQLNEIVLGKVTKVLNYGFFMCKIESSVSQGDLDQYANGINEFHYHITSDQLFPLGTFEKEIPAPRPMDWLRYIGAEFNWAEYLKKRGAEALSLPPKTEESTVHEFTENMWVEAVDSLRPELVCPAIIHRIVHPYAMKIHFLGWSENIDQWKPLKSLEIFPMGWSQFVGFPLEPAPEPEPIRPRHNSTSNAPEVPVRAPKENKKAVAVAVRKPFPEKKKEKAQGSSQSQSQVKLPIPVDGKNNSLIGTMILQRAKGSIGTTPNRYKPY